MTNNYNLSDFSIEDPNINNLISELKINDIYTKYLVYKFMENIYSNFSIQPILSSMLPY